MSYTKVLDKLRLCAKRMGVRIVKEPGLKHRVGSPAMYSSMVWEESIISPTITTDKHQSKGMEVLHFAHELGHHLTDTLCSGAELKAERTAKTIYQDEVNAWDNAKVLLKLAGFEAWGEYRKKRRYCLALYKKAL